MLQIIKMLQLWFALKHFVTILSNFHINVLKRFSNRIFALLDTLPDYPWINNAEFPVQNLENIPEHNITAQEVLEETILSPAENMLGTKEELDHFFPEEFIDLATLESNMNSFDIDPLASLLVPDNVHITDCLDDLLVDIKEGVPCQNACQIPNNFPNVFRSESAPENHTISEPISDTTAVVPDVVPESPLSVPESPEDTTDAGVFANDLSLNINQLNPAILELLEDLEKSVETNVEANSRKRSLEMKEESNDPTEAPVSKKKRLPSSSSTDAGAAPDKIVERRIKNNAASRVCRASRKARHGKLFEQEKELLEENKVLTSKVKELTITVEYLRSYLVNRLSGQCN